jgi:Uma2 family endonuclease
VSEAAVAPSPFPLTRDWTLDDLQALPDDANRYEIVDGSLLVSPPPNTGHSGVVAVLTRLLSAAATEDLAVYPGMTGVTIGRSVLVPDVVVVRAEVARRQRPAFTAEDVVLAVEVLSPSNRVTDLVTKRSQYAVGGIDHYWIVDPETPALTVLRRAGDAYDELAVVRADEAYDAAEPFTVTVVPAKLGEPPTGRGPSRSDR